MIRSRFFCAALFVALAVLPLRAEVRRIVIVKVDGLSDDVVQRALVEKDKKTQLSKLPWIEDVFVRHGTRLRDFYSRGLSLSVPSWSILDSGQHLQIFGNAEYDRYTLKVYDYLNFFPFYLNYAFSKKVDMPSVEVLDDGGVHLLIDYFPRAESYQGFQLYQRGVRWTTLRDSLTNRFTTRSVRDLLDEWETGLEMSSSVNEQMERELVEKLGNPQIRYLDYFTGEFDHLGHASNRPEVLDGALEHIDGIIGRIWSAIQATPERDYTALVMVSDHGMNNTPGAYSQGYSLLDFFRSSIGGGHHVILNRYAMDEYKLKGLYPFVSKVVNKSEASPYLQGKENQYPTAILDLDGNERGAVQLRNNTFNELQILLTELQRTDLKPELRSATVAAISRIVEEHQDQWRRRVDQLQGHLDWLEGEIERETPKNGLKKVKFDAEDKTQGIDKEYRRRIARIERLKEAQRGYRAYSSALSKLANLKAAAILHGHFHMGDLIPERSLGEVNSVFDLQNYAVGLGRQGLSLDASGRLDLGRSIARLNYFPLIANLQVRNATQPNVPSKPVDFIALNVPAAEVTRVLGDPCDRAVWLYGSEELQALVVSRAHGDTSELRYIPVAGLHQLRNGELVFAEAAWRDHLPLAVWEDRNLDTGGADRKQWLSSWHTDREWLIASHRTRYSNGVTGILEALRLPESESRSTSGHANSAQPVDSAAGELTPEALAFHDFTRDRTDIEFLVFANDHWNFNVRNFNPGGNHGSFLRISTHSTLMFAGGSKTGIPQGLEVTTPYDGLSFVPTVLKIMRLKPLPGTTYPGVPILELASHDQ